ncbi:MAG: hypothetical protein LBN30_02370 [Oscillospiraceae bacterium]|nr:hypothetical protein [Oscillospiraceae bacterium]
MQDDVNILAQPNKEKWLQNPPSVKPGDMRAAIACANKADGLECDCWNTKCAHHGDCRKCIVYEMCLKQLPTCARDLYAELQEHHAAYTAGK